MNRHMKIRRNRHLVISLMMVWLVVMIPAPSIAGGSTCSNTYRHIYNQSRCTISMWVYPTDGNMYCNGGQNAFSIQPNTSPEYELTTSSCLSAGKIHVRNLAQGDMVFDYHLSSGGAFTMQWFKSSYGGDWGAANVNGCGSIGWKINSPAMGDITFCNSTCQ